MTRPANRLRQIERLLLGSAKPVAQGHVYGPPESARNAQRQTENIEAAELCVCRKPVRKEGLNIEYERVTRCGTPGSRSTAEAELCLRVEGQRQLRHLTRRRKECDGSYQATLMVGLYRLDDRGLQGYAQPCSYGRWRSECSLNRACRKCPTHCKTPRHRARLKGEWELQVITKEGLRETCRYREGHRSAACGELDCRVVDRDQRAGLESHGERSGHIVRERRRQGDGKTGLLSGDQRLGSKSKLRRRRRGDLRYIRR